MLICKIGRYKKIDTLLNVNWEEKQLANKKKKTLNYNSFLGAHQIKLKYSIKIIEIKNHKINKQ